MAVELREGDVVVREWRDGDAPALVPLVDDRDVWINLRDAFPHPYRIRDAREFVARAQRLRPPTWFAIEAGGALAGGIGYVPRPDVERIGAEIGYWLGRPFWGRGIMTTALRLTSAHAFAADPDLRRVFALPFTTNMASARVLEKAGYVREGTLRQSVIKDGRVLDQWMYATVRGEGSEP